MSGENTTFEALYAVLKNELKARGVTYRDVAQALETTPSSIKMRFANRNLSVRQLIAITELLDMTLTGIMQKVEHPDARHLTLQQETALAADPQLLLVLREVMDDHPITEITGKFNLDKVQCIKSLLELDRLELIDLLPNNVVRKRLQRNVEWLPNGPLQQLVTSRIDDYLESHFDKSCEKMIFARAELTDAAISALQADMAHLRNRVTTLHEECKFAPPRERRRIVLMTAEREWELPDLRAMRRSLPRQNEAPLVRKRPEVEAD